MGSTTLVREALRRVSDQLHDLNPQFVRWDQHSLVNALNDGQRVIAKFLPSSCSRVDSFKLAPGTKQSISTVPYTSIIPGDGSTPVDLQGNCLVSAPIRNMGADGMTPGRSIRAVERGVLDQSDPNWHTKVGSVVTQVVYDKQLPQVFYVSPGHAAGDAQQWIEIAWVPDPVEISLSGDYSASGSSTVKLSIDDVNVDDLTNYIIARAYLKDSEMAASMVLGTTFAQYFASSINTQSVAAGLPNPKLTGLPPVARG